VSLSFRDKLLALCQMRGKILVALLQLRKDVLHVRDSQHHGMQQKDNNAYSQVHRTSLARLAA
jgi:hypothetical protein